MKKIIFLLFPLICFSQTEKFCLNVSNDDVTATSKIYSDEIDLGEFKFYVLAGKTRGTYTQIIFKLKGGDCVDEYSNIYFLFENGKRFEGHNHVYTFNCSGNSGQILNTGGINERLKTDKVKTIRIDAKSKFFQADLNEEQQNLLMNYVKCASDWKAYKDLMKFK